MGRSYYYFACSLPILNFEGQAAVTLEDFLNDCERLLNEEDFVLMQNILSGNFAEVNCNNLTFRSCVEFYGRFNNIITAFRASRANRDPQDYIRGEFYQDPKLTEVVNQAAKEENLLKAEQIIDKMRWEFLDDIVVGHYFDFDFLVVYGLKLKILERYAAINTTEGQEKFEEIKKMDLSELEIQHV